MVDPQRRFSFVVAPTALSTQLGGEGAGCLLGRNYLLLSPGFSCRLAPTCSNVKRRPIAALISSSAAHGVHDDPVDSSPTSWSLLLPPRGVFPISNRGDTTKNAKTTWSSSPFAFLGPNATRDCENALNISCNSTILCLDSSSTSQQEHSHKLVQGDTLPDGPAETFPLFPSRSAALQFIHASAHVQDGSCHL